MAAKWTIGIAPEEPDTFLIGSDGMIWCRVVGHPEEPAEPKARLMWAAPKLLEALQALTEWGRTFTSPLDAHSPHDLLVKAVAAIAEATVETAASAGSTTVPVKLAKVKFDDVVVKWEPMVSKAKFDEVVELLDNVSAALSTVMLWHGHLMPEGDRTNRNDLVDKARVLCNQLLRSEGANANGRTIPAAE